MALTGKAVRLRIYIGEEEYYNKKPMYRAILEKARKLDIAGGTVFRCMEGYGANTRQIRASKFLDLSSDLPVVVELIDKKEKLELLRGFLKENLKKGLLTSEEVNVLAYSADFSLPGEDGEE